MQQLAGLAEIRKMLGDLSRQRAYQLTQSPDFPKPAAELSMGKIWKVEDVRRWAEAHGRAIQEL